MLLVFLFKIKQYLFLECFIFVGEDMMEEAGWGDGPGDGPGAGGGIGSHSLAGQGYKPINSWAGKPDEPG